MLLLSLATHYVVSLDPLTKRSHSVVFANDMHRFHFRILSNTKGPKVAVRGSCLTLLLFYAPSHAPEVYNIENNSKPVVSENISTMNSKDGTQKVNCFIIIIKSLS